MFISVNVLQKKRLKGNEKENCCSLVIIYINTLQYTYIDILEQCVIS